MGIGIQLRWEGMNWKDLTKQECRGKRRFGWLELVFMRLERCGVLHLRQFSLLALINNSVAPELDLLDWLRSTGNVLSSRDILLRHP